MSPDIIIQKIVHMFILVRHQRNFLFWSYGTRPDSSGLVSSCQLMQLKQDFYSLHFPAQQNHQIMLRVLLY